MDSDVEMKSEDTPTGTTADLEPGPKGMAAEAEGAGRPEAAEPTVPEKTALLEGAEAGRSDAPSDQPVAPSPAAETAHPAAEVVIRLPPPADAASPQLGDALAALDSRDYATARRLFEGLGRGEAAQAIDTALAALDRKDYATAQGLFEALATLKPNAPQAHAAFPAPIPLASKPEAVIPAPPAIVPASPRAALPEVTRDALPEIGQGAPPDVHKSPPPLAVVPDDHRTSIGAASAPPPRRSRRLAAAAVLALLALCGLAAFHRSREWALAAAEGPGRSGLASAVAMIEAPLKAIGGSKEDRDAVSTLRGQLAEATMRLEKLEKADAERDARVDGLSARFDQGAASAKEDSAASAGLSTKVDQIEARLDQADKRVAGLAASGSKMADAAATKAADVSARLDRLEKRADAGTAMTQPGGLAHAVPIAPKPGSAANVAEAPLPPLPINRPASLPKPPSPLASNGPGAVGPAAPRLLGDYSVEDVQGGVALVDGRYGEQSVAPGDVIPGAGRVLRIERHGNEWFVVTSNGVIASNPAPF